jgi:peptidoglycan/xylan/chitin deacetylase (PgdA/CDA1 family)
LTSVEIEKTTFEEMAQMLVTDYEVNGRKSGEAMLCRVSRLRAYFGQRLAAEITSDRITTYVQSRRGASAATIRYELAMLKRMFRLAARAGKVAHRPEFLTVRVRPLWRDFPIVRESPPRPVRHRLRLSFALVALLLLVWFGEGTFGPQGNLFGKTYWHGDTNQKVVALTFDDGPNEPYTSRVLNILKRQHVRATFFLIGENTRRFRETAARIVREGHAVGNHSDRHTVPFALQSESEMTAQVDSAEETIRSATGEFTRLFRPPQGLRSPWLMHVLERDSLITVTWDDAPGDWDPMTTATLIDRTVLNAHPGSIILLHDGMNLTHGANQSTTVMGLEPIIQQLRARGYSFVTLPELLHCSPTLSAWPPVKRPVAGVHSGGRGPRHA